MSSRNLCTILLLLVLCPLRSFGILQVANAVGAAVAVQGKQNQMIVMIQKILKYLLES